MSPFIERAMELSQSIARHYYRWDSLRFVLSPRDCADAMRNAGARTLPTTGMNLLKLQTSFGEAEITPDHEIPDGRCLVLWIVDRNLWRVWFEIDGDLPDVSPSELMKDAKAPDANSARPQIAICAEPSPPAEHTTKMKHDDFASRMRARRGDRPLPEVKTLGLAESPTLPIDAILGGTLADGEAIVPGEFMTVDELRRLRGLPPLATAVLDEAVQSLGLTRSRGESDASVRERLRRITGR